MMFVTKKRFLAVVEALRHDIEYEQNRFWVLWHKHQRLLDHLGLKEIEIEAATKLVPLPKKKQ